MSPPPPVSQVEFTALQIVGNIHQTWAHVLPNRVLKWNIPTPQSHAMLDGQLTRGTGCAISLWKINIPSESSSPKIVTLLLYFSFICLPTAVTKHILTEAKGIISQSTFGCRDSAKCAPETGILYGLPTWESIKKQKDPPSACLHDISVKPYTQNGIVVIGGFLFKKSTLFAGNISAVVTHHIPCVGLAAKFKVFSVYPLSMSYWHEEMF